MNVDGNTSSNRKTCSTCWGNLCAHSGPCSNVGDYGFSCEVACDAEMQFYDDLSRSGTCNPVSCGPAHVVMTAQ